VMYLCGAGLDWVVLYAVLTIFLTNPLNISITMLVRVYDYSSIILKT